MRLKELFTVPEGQKITEKVFSRVLVSSICSILLCMTCLFSTTWAWFAVDIENRDNVIEIASVTLDAGIFKGEEEVQNENGTYELSQGTYHLKAQVTSTATEPDDFGKRATVYVVMTVGETKYYFASLPVDRSIYLDTDAAVSFTVSWIQPDNARPLSDLPEAAPVGQISDDSVEETTAPMTETVTTEPTVPMTEPVTEALTEKASEPVTETPSESITEASSEAVTEESQDTSEDT